MKIDFKNFLRKLKILPVLIVVASFGFVVRLGESYMSLKNMSGSAYAEEAKPTDEKAAEKKPSVPDSPVDPPKEELKSSTAPEEKTDEAAGEKKAGADDIDLPSTDSASSEEKGGSLKKWQDASDSDSEESTIKEEVFQDLTKRRAALDQREQKLSEREALLEAAQKELDKKLTEMEGVRDELKDLLKQQTAEEAARIQSLVKIYSGMKPKDAARIFNTLDTDILMDVVSNMTESKAGPIIALMEADRAKALTTLLAEQKKLPEVP